MPALKSLGFFASGGEAALTNAIRGVEAMSSAEVVVVVRRKSGSYLHADLIAGAVAAFAALAFLLFSPWPFSVEWTLLDPLVAFILAAICSSRSERVRRRLTPFAERLRRVETHARAAFVERGVCRTSKRTGVLVYVSILEKAASVVADDGVSAAVPDAEWSAAVATIGEAAKSGRSVEVAAALASLGPLLGRVLPCSAEDVNELPDEVCSE